MLNLRPFYKKRLRELQPKNVTAQRSVQKERKHNDRMGKHKEEKGWNTKLYMSWKHLVCDQVKSKIDLKK